jgi:hypothetical protein
MSKSATMTLLVFSAGHPDAAGGLRHENIQAMRSGSVVARCRPPCPLRISRPSLFDHARLEMAGALPSAVVAKILMPASAYRSAASSMDCACGAFIGNILLDMP